MLVHKCIILFLIISTISPYCSGKLHFALIPDIGWVPAITRLQNGYKLFYAIYEVQGEEWVIENILMGYQHDSRVGFGNDNHLILECSLAKSHSIRNLDFLKSKSLEFLEGIKNGIDRMASNDDTIFLYNPTIKMDIDRYNTDPIYHRECINEIYTNFRDLFFSTDLQIKYISYTQHKIDKDIVIEYSPLFRSLRITSNEEVENSNEIKKDYEKKCMDYHLKMIGSKDYRNRDDAEYDAYVVYLEFLLKQMNEYLTTQDSIRYVMLPITYDVMPSTQTMLIKDYIHNQKNDVREENPLIQKHVWSVICVIFLLPIIVYVILQRRK